MEKIYSAKEINEYMGYNKSQQNDSKQQFMTRCKNAGLIVEDIPTKRGCKNLYKIIEDNFKKDGEEWVQCYCNPDWEVSNLGRIRRVSTKKLLGGLSKGESYITITGNPNGKQQRFMLHRLVYFSFNPEQIKLAESLFIDHINGCRTDNQLINLRAVSPRRNVEAREENNKGLQALLGELIIKHGYDKVYEYLNNFVSESKTI